MSLQETGGVRRKRGWFQFSLRTLLLVTTLCALFFGLWAKYVEPYRVQREAIAAIARLGGTLRTEPAGPAWVRALVGAEHFVNVVEVHFLCDRVTDADLRHLKGLKHLRQLWIAGAGYAITDAGLENLKGLKELRYVWLHDTQVTNLGVSNLRRILPGATTALSGRNAPSQKISNVSGATSL